MMASKQREEINQKGRKPTNSEAKQSSSQQTSLAKGLGLLEFRNPGPKFIEEFNPCSSTRERRKAKRKVYIEKRKKNQIYNQYGGLLDQEGRDVCDCLDPQCPGCHFPCPKCSSEKCGTDCRTNRCWYYEMIEIEGEGQTIHFPTPQPKGKVWHQKGV